MMRTTPITRVRLQAGTGTLVLYQSARAWYVVYEDAQGHTTPLRGAQYWTYDAAHSRLQHEWQRRQADA
jgi:hypothetical protein